METVMWFRRDLRIQDNKALYHAFNSLGSDDKLVLLFQVNPEQFIDDNFNQQAFFLSVNFFKNMLLDKGAYLQIVYGDPITSFKRLKELLPKWNHVYFNEDSSGYGFKRDKDMLTLFSEIGVMPHFYQDAYLHGASEISKQNGDCYKVYTPYYKRWIEEIKETPINVEFSAAKTFQKSLFLEDEHKLLNLTKNFTIDSLEPGEFAAQEQLSDFIENSLSKYPVTRDYPSLDATSHLSQYLRTGAISVRTIWNEIDKVNDSDGKLVFQKQLCWREFYNMIYSNFPNQKSKPLQPKFQYINWDNNEELFKQWQSGLTGYPLIDAAMRQLKETGWMHNRLRMITASFLVKDLLIDWRWGEKYFEHMLIDYDPANNIGGWQWAASTGTDAAPYFRVFNPITQSKKFDQHGEFIRKYVKELANVPDEFIHQPNLMSVEQQQAYKVIIGETYPYPIVEHSEQRKKAIALYESSKEYAQEIINDSVLE